MDLNLQLCSENRVVVRVIRLVGINLNFTNTVVTIKANVLICR